MSMFKKKINLKATEMYLRHAIQNMLSEEEQATHIHKLREVAKGVPEFSEVKQSTFSDNLTAVNLQLLDFAWAEFQKKSGASPLRNLEINLELRRIESSIPGYDDYDDLYTDYNQALARGNPQADSFDQMSLTFLTHVLPEKVQHDITTERAQEVHTIISQLLRESITSFYQDMKDLKLIS
jgi:hypothetical protein